MNFDLVVSEKTDDVFDLDVQEVATPVSSAVTRDTADTCVADTCGPCTDLC
ncbi:hypothetical protein ACIBK8_08765 [Streptomyces sp. NPDC050161]|uniref:hypothetical protein n=1 Tax=Streptomyces sp. NPDC050161 TaxID=3365604 RepID=UPI0037912D75